MFFLLGVAWQYADLNTATAATFPGKMHCVVSKKQWIDKAYSTKIGLVKRYDFFAIMADGSQANPQPEN
jgi:hypothetical protein